VAFLNPNRLGGAIDLQERTLAGWGEPIQRLAWCQQAANCTASGIYDMTRAALTLALNTKAQSREEKQGKNRKNQEAAF
jgi:hypothetical protein